MRERILKQKISQFDSPPRVQPCKFEVFYFLFDDYRKVPLKPLTSQRDGCVKCHNQDIFTKVLPFQ